MESILLAMALTTAPIDRTTFNNPLIEQETAIVQPVEEIKELTIEEKIAQNHYECDESVEYIRADNAQCLSKPVYTPNHTRTAVSAQSPSKTIKRSSSTAPSGWYPYGNCTFWVSTQRSVGQWNNASDWVWQAQRDGWSTGTTPAVGAIGQKANHVVYVTRVNSDGTFNLSEMNYRGLGVITTRTVDTSGWRFIY